MTEIDDYRKPDGRTDWTAYHAAQEAAGERCKQCGASIIDLSSLFRRADVHNERGPRKCYDCGQLDTAKKPVRHETFVRCPKCNHCEDITDGDCYELYGDGEHNFTCDECDYDFEVVTHVAYEFESPAMEEENADA